MLINDYQCKKCNKNIEKCVESNNEKVICPECNSIMIKLISPVSFILKGKNWAKDGYGLKEQKRKSSKPKPDK